MGSRETQSRILSAALRLFNEHGTSNVSTHGIAAECGISKGNLNYHYARKSDIILDLFLQMSDEVHSSWRDDFGAPSLDQLAFMFYRELRLMWRYRFFYRELVQLLRDDDVLRRRFDELRKRRVEDGQKFLHALVAHGHLRALGHPDEFELLTTNTWLLTNHWLNFVETTGGQMDRTALLRGFRVMLHMVRPYVTERGLQTFDERAHPDFGLDD
jgi:AcrR family transcriptional regulator